MSFFSYYLLPFVVILGILIFFHELGHFLVAKYFGVRVLKFSLGFGKKIIGKKIGDTEYLISMVPLGGYVKMLGESGDDDTEPLTREEEKSSFSHQHVLKRMAIVAAGPLFNLLLALIIFSLFYINVGKQVMEPEIGQVREHSPAESAGLKKGDLILAVDGKQVEAWAEIKEAVHDRAGKSVLLVVRRDQQLLHFTVTPEESISKNIFGEDIKTALIGIVASGKFKTLNLPTGTAVVEAGKKTWEVIWLTCLTVVKLFERVIPIKTIGGPILIGQMTGQLAQESFLYLIPFMAVISINLGILNLLPVPILDGGFLVFLFIELIIGKPLSLKKRDMAQKVGLFLLIMLMVIVLFNDITRLFK
ncbi:MAG TPA: RIP metalloprotease RseP [Desulfobacteraceae bacterium]|nr:RIP metalloprotease RseP [Desulfobacteraceae bacterium]